MKHAILSLLCGTLLLLSAASAQTVTGEFNMQADTWTTCVYPACNPGGIGTPTRTINREIEAGTFDGAMEFYVAGPPYSNVLFWKKIGATNATSFIAEMDFYITRSMAESAEALEIDPFAFTQPYRFMFGSECVRGGKWQVWNDLTGHWIDTTRACDALGVGWHHLQWIVHRTSNAIVYDLLDVDGYYSAFNITEPAGLMPASWTNNSGLNIQLDMSADGNPISIYVTNISLVEVE